MSASEPPWDPGAAGDVPVGPEPEPTGGGGTGGEGGWGAPPPTEPFAVAALVWAIVSIVLPIIATVVAFVLAARASDIIRRSNGAVGGQRLVTAARVVAGVVIGLWAIGVIVFLATGGADSDDGSVAVPTRPSVSSTSTTAPPATTTTPSPTAPPATTLAPVAPSTTIVPPPTIPPTAPPSTQAPPTAPPPTEPPPTTQAPPTTTPADRQAAILQERLLEHPRLGPSNRGVPDDERFVVAYESGQPLVVHWAINDGAPPLPSGDESCPPQSTSTTTTTTTTEPGDDEPGATSSSAPGTTSEPGEEEPTTTTTTPVPGEPTDLETSQLARYEAKQIVRVVRNRLDKLETDFVQLVGTYPIGGGSDVVVVRVVYSRSTVEDPDFTFASAFDVPPAETLDCINAAFASAHGS
jgi:hypothetical protein